MKPTFISLLILYIFLYSCKPATNKQFLPEDVFVPTCDKPDIKEHGDGKETIIVDDDNKDHKAELGKSGCVPKGKLVLKTEKYFCDFSAKDADDSSFYYIPYQTVYVHQSNGKLKSFSPGYYRSKESEYSKWNGRIDSCGFTDQAFGVGICTLSNYTLINDGHDRWYFENKALVYNKKVCPNKECL